MALPLLLSWLATSPADAAGFFLNMAFAVCEYISGLSSFPTRSSPPPATVQKGPPHNLLLPVFPPPPIFPKHYQTSSYQPEEVEWNFRDLGKWPNE